jgi:DNA polymerase I-like protein with 3'-5' exonuclease and polymerase domains
MIRCYKKLQGTNAWIALQVHDEIVFDFPYKANKGNLDEVNKLRVLMERSGKDIGIPLKVSVSYHPNNWMQSV